MIVIELLLCVAAVLTLLPAALLFLQLAAALPAYRPRPMPAGPRPAVAVVIPAHDEAAGIAHTVRCIAAQLARGDRLLVVADNCSDDTAAAAAAAGAAVIERNDPARRGKGFALDFAVGHLQASAPDVVIVIDADCLVAPGTIERLARTAARSARPVQSSNLMHSPPGASLKTRIAEFAWLVKTELRALGCQRLGLPCQLMGTGMALPWAALAASELASGDIVEDIKLGLRLARSGRAPLFCPEARVTSLFPSDAAGMYAQRARWEHGHLGTILRDAPPLLAEAIASRNIGLLALVADLCVPPLSLLITLTLALVAAGGALAALTAFSLALSALLMLLCALLLAWSRHGRHILRLRELARAPLYVLWKMPLYARFLGKRQLEWVRARRAHE